MSTSTLPDSDARAENVKRVMARIREMVKGPNFEQVRPARWAALPSRIEVETGYSHGEGRVRVYSTTGELLSQFTFTGSDDCRDLARFKGLFPEYSRIPEPVNY